MRLYEAEYDPTLPNLSIDGIPAQTVPQSCVSETDDDSSCRYLWERRTVGPHHHCGGDCSYKCEAFVCNKCLAITDKMLLHAKTYEMADKYDVVGLKAICIEKHKRACLEF